MKSKSGKQILCLLVIFLPGTLLPVQAQELGRLFLTPEQRVRLEQLRIRSNQPRPVVVEAPEPELPAPVIDLEPEEVLFAHGGSMRRGDGSYTIWLNGIAYSDDELPANVSLVIPYDQGQLRITDPDSGRSYRLKPGQVLNLGTGSLREAYQPDASAGGTDAEADSQLPGADQ